MREIVVTVSHRRRLREVYRSAGWPCQDTLEVELLAAGLLERRTGALGHETLRVTDAGITVIAETLQRNRARLATHECLVERVARAMVGSGRLAWRGLALRAKVEDRWSMAMPDVFSIRHTTVEAWLEPIVHEIKVRRADLLSDLRNPAKRAAYLQFSSECWYVVRSGIAAPEEIPPECGLLVAHDSGALEVARAAPKRPMQMSLGLWMALARATPLDGWRLDDAQGLLGEDREGCRAAG
ncbi:MAG: hypothetical protein M3O01_15385 [Pseudomonadota bacterium]|nr:hypothetical protein [Pseudomonadota bacterium]